MTPALTTSDNLTLLPFATDPLETLAKLLLQENLERLPRLEQVTVLLPDGSQIPRLRQLLLQHAENLGYNALLGPRIVDWRNWLAEVPIDDRAVASDYRRELILIQALHKHDRLFGAANHWALADSLLQLFDELTLNKVGLPESIEDFQQRVARGYGLVPNTLTAMEQETRLVYTLWQAWHQELEQRTLLDRNTRHLLQLASVLNQPLEDQIYLIAPMTTCAAEREWLAKMAARDGVQLLLQGHINSGLTSARTLHPETPLRQLLSAMEIGEITCTGTSHYSRMLDEVFSTTTDKPLRQRAHNFATEVPESPLQQRLAVFAADDDEKEARAVELQVRRWLLQEKKRIGIVSDNRRLARRVRALLERAMVPVEDSAGWALSTTSAAAALERWLQCIEEDFPHQAMLDLLKSPFFCEDEQREGHLADVYLLERDIVLHENIGSGIARYRRHLKFRQGRLLPELAARLNPVDKLLQQLQQAALPIQKCLQRNSCSATQLLGHLLDSLNTLGIETQLAADDAGMRLLEELQKMSQAATEEPHTLDWLAFRTWLGRNLERYDFKPAVSGRPVTLMELSGSTMGHYDCLVIASAEREHLPGAPPGSPFFNDAVRQELGLPTADEQLATCFYHFRRLLESAPDILLTHCVERDGEKVITGSWLELLLAFQQLAYDNPPDDLGLADLLQSEDSAIVSKRPLPQQSAMPSPIISQNLLPKRYSPSAYQQLMDCPYQFFAARGLGLAPPDAIREALEKSDYGERVHSCLQAFHGNVKKLPGPFSGEWKAERREEAIALLEQISEAVFARDLEDNFLHRSWLQRWKRHIPDYIDWQLERAGQWQVKEVEQQLQQEHRIPGIILHGRLDRCDSNGTAQAIVDYKTSRKLPDMDSVTSGEAIQLPFYALLAAQGSQPVERVEYLSLDAGKVTGRTLLQGDELEELSQKVGERLGILQQQMHQGTPLPAWGTEETCSHCRFSGVCRRAVWLEK